VPQLPHDHVAIQRIVSGVREVTRIVVVGDATRSICFREEPVEEEEDDEKREPDDGDEDDNRGGYSE
jgi:hypothetical protein